MKRNWIVSDLFDASFFLAPGLLPVLAVLCMPSLRGASVPFWGWVGIVVCIDVAHTWSVMYRTYLDPEELKRNRTFLLTVPALTWIAGLTLYSFGWMNLWRVYTYGAVYHFMRQQYGFMRYYQHLEKTRSVLDQWFDKAAIYVGMGYPVLFWHADPSRRHAAWFGGAQRAFFDLPAFLVPAGRSIFWATMLLFCLRQLMLAARHRTFNRGKVGLIAATVMTWYVGMVYLDSEFAFLITIAIAHGIPYFALVWLYGRRKWAGNPTWRGKLFSPTAAGVISFIGLMAALAYLEEGVRDIVIKAYPAAFFGFTRSVAASPILVGAIMPLLLALQFSHYIFDAYLWRLSGVNPDLKRILFDERQ